MAAGGRAGGRAGGNEPAAVHSLNRLVGVRTARKIAPHAMTCNRRHRTAVLLRGPLLSGLPLDVLKQEQRQGAQRTSFS